MSTSLTTIVHKIMQVFEAVDKLNGSINGHGRTEIFRKVSRASRQSFRSVGFGSTKFHLRDSTFH